MRPARLCAGPVGAEGASKIAAQLAAAKAADLDRLTELAAAACGIGGAAEAPPAATDEGGEPQAPAADPGPASSGSECLTVRRVLGARCVQQLLASIRLQLQGLSEAQARREARPAEPPSSSGQGAQRGSGREEQLGASDSGGSRAPSSSEGEEGSGGEETAKLQTARHELLAAAGKGPMQAAPDKKRKKNRLGQRARQRLAAEQGRDMPSAALRPKPAPRNLAAESADTEGMHPSWVAKRKQAVRISVVSAPPKNKITFAEDE